MTCRKDPSGPIACSIDWDNLSFEDDELPPTTDTGAKE